MHRPIDVVRSSEERFAKILAMSADAIICVDAQQHITLFNEGAERTFGYSAREILGRPLDVLIPDRFRGHHDAHVRGFIDGRPNSRHMADRQAVFALRRNGEEFPADASISKIEVGGEAVYTVVLRDVSERFRREQERQIEAQRLSVVMNAGRLGGFEYDQQSDSVRLLGHAASILGVEGDAIDVERWFALIHRDDAERVAESMRKVARGGQPAGNGIQAGLPRQWRALGPRGGL
ncbi:MAG: PAS domain S-box protein, partial [Aquincola sp.]|nr:PAS domain S-box protein [Aquincola sp.]